MLVNEYYIVQRSRNQGKWWVTLTSGIECLSEKHAREYMESLHREHPSDWYRTVRHTEEAEAGYFGTESYDKKLQEEYESRPNLRAGEPSSNTAARDALRRIDTLLVSMNCDSSQKRVVDTCRMIVKRALSEPPRNCDVGTAEEQYDRYIKFCNRLRLMKSNCDMDCPCAAKNFNNHFCQLEWAQMPCEEKGETDGSK